MYSIGDRLKDARMSKGLSIEDIQEATKIRRRYIEAIEESQLAVLPGESYARTFVKLYAEEVGFDGDQLAKEFEDENKQFFIEQEKKQAAKKKGKRRRFNPKNDGNIDTVIDSLPMIIAIVLIICIVVAIYIAGSSVNSSPDQSIINSDGSEPASIMTLDEEIEEDQASQ